MVFSSQLGGIHYSLRVEEHNILAFRLMIEEKRRGRVERIGEGEREKEREEEDERRDIVREVPPKLLLCLLCK